jgi:hypothetical protein
VFAREREAQEQTILLLLARRGSQGAVHGVQHESSSHSHHMVASDIPRIPTSPLLPSTWFLAPHLTSAQLVSSTLPALNLSSTYPTATDVLYHAHRQDLSPPAFYIGVVNDNTALPATLTLTARWASASTRVCPNVGALTLVASQVTSSRAWRMMITRHWYGQVRWSCMAAAQGQLHGAPAAENGLSSAGRAKACAITM